MILRIGGYGMYITHYKAKLNAMNEDLHMGHASLEGYLYDDAMKALVKAFQTEQGIGGVVPELGALDDLTRDLLSGYSRIQ